MKSPDFVTLFMAARIEVEEIRKLSSEYRQVAQRAFDVAESSKKAAAGLTAPQPGKSDIARSKL